MRGILYILLFFYANTYCQNNVKTLVHSENISIIPLDSLNSNYRETNISISPDGRYLFFMSTRGGQKWNNEASSYYKQSGYDGDIWFSKKVQGKWLKSLVVNYPINTGEGEDEPVISPDGQTIYYQSWKDNWKNAGGPYYKAQLNGETWEKSEGMGDSITTFFKNAFSKDEQAATDGMTVSPNGKIFIVAYSKRLDLPMDLYFSKKTNSKWSYLRKMNLNTSMDERSVFIASDGKTVYFASNGYGGFGGLDIFKTTIDENGNHSEILNIGKPFNTEKDDYSFIINASGERAYFVRDGDIYSADISEANHNLKPNATKIISGILKNNLNQPINAEVRLVDINTKEIISTSLSNIKNGEYSIVSPLTMGDFELQIYYKNDSIKSIPLHFSNDSLNESYEINASIDNITHKIKSISTLITVYFDYDKDVLKDYYKTPINSTLSSFPFISIKSIDICGYTDSDGSNAYNLKLGRKRANSVANYINTLQNLPQNIKSQGKLNPISSNLIEEGKAFNRRVEIKITWEF